MSAPMPSHSPGESSRLQSMLTRYQHTLTTGVISATKQDLELINQKTGQRVIYTDLIQTDGGGTHIPL